MKNKMMRIAAATLVGVLATAPAWSLERAEIPEQYTWNLADLYADTAAWEAARVALGS
jgi:dTDP-4-amino-4,6-dideoxygalactose transaminase